jgi:hypothetical protein
MDERHINWKFEVSFGCLVHHQGCGRCSLDFQAIAVAIHLLLLEGWR